MKNSDIENTGYYQLQRNKDLIQKYPHIDITHNNTTAKYFLHHATEDNGQVMLYFFNVEQFNKFPFEDIFKVNNTSALFYDTITDSGLLDFIQIDCNDEKHLDKIKPDHYPIIVNILIDIFGIKEEICEKFLFISLNYFCKKLSN